MSGIGFTGSRYGMSERQRLVVRQHLVGQQSLVFDKVFHHGDCIGADEQAHKIAKKLKYRIMLHPPIDRKDRAFCKLDLLDHSLEEKAYLARNHDIVDAAQFMIAAPNGKIEIKRSGTWATIRYAIKCWVPLVIVFPDGLEKRYG